MPPSPDGLHHVTCVCHEHERTIAFYEALGFDLVKDTVNHDAPETRHIYLANAAGDPGTTITFFEWPSERTGRPGLESAQHVGLDLPPEPGLDDAAELLEERGAEVQRVTDHGTDCLETSDPDGLALRLFETDEGPRLRQVGLYGGVDERRVWFADQLGLEVTDEDPPRVLAPSGEPIVTLLGANPDRGWIEPGAVHHVAFAVDEDTQKSLLQSLREAGQRVTDVVDRVYFRSVYTRDPVGHIVEFATPGPGFAEDEPADELGERLVLPPWLEDKRDRIEEALEDQVEKARSMLAE